MSSAQKRVQDFLSNLLRLDERETGFFTGIRPEGIPYKQGVVGSSPTVPTTISRKIDLDIFLCVPDMGDNSTVKVRYTLGSRKC